MNPLIVNVRNAKGGFVYVGRAMHARGLAESPYANPFPITKTETRRRVLLDYIEHFIAQVSANNTDFRPEVLSRLAGKRLGSCTQRVYTRFPWDTTSQYIEDSLSNAMDYVKDAVTNQLKGNVSITPA